MKYVNRPTLESGLRILLHVRHGKHRAHVRSLIAQSIAILRNAP